MAKSFGPYSPTRNAGSLMFVSGQVGVNSQDKSVPADITGQTRNVLVNIEHILVSENLSMDDIVKATVFITNMDNFSTMNEEYVNHFPGEKPARSCVAVKELPRVGGDTPILVEIEVVVSRGGK